MTTGPADAGRSLRFERLLAHPPERVWAALTSPEDLKQWMPAQEVRIEPHAGGTIAGHLPS
ncbi:MAG TPA: SRPBCC domain-containing protein, partial [Candidatus Thermoplasmatota archaeon]|nr:SRPBCC domain-containing protein [Candidatus Thermoplasmatota archaeon]